jgi:DNA-binding FrmR family transcriptional regulator
MSTLTQAQARSLAEDFFEISKAVGDYRFAHFDDLTPDQLNALHSLQQQLSNQSNHFTAVAIEITLDDLQPTLARINQITGQVTTAVTTLNDIRRVISIATSIVSLGAALASGSPATIAAAIQDTVQSVQG